MFDRKFCEEFFDNNERVRVVFEKKDKSKRTMICTRKLYMIDESFHPKTDPENAQPPSEVVFPVFDLEANGWRSFKFDSIISIDQEDTTFAEV